MVARGGSFAGTERFEIRSRIGEGASGVVYAAYDRARKTMVALKTLGTRSSESLLLLKSEFRSVQDLQHPNLVQLGELIEDHGEWFFTMELVNGVDFLAYVRPHGRVEEGRLRTALVQLVRGLHALHSAHKIHRDVKPSNVLVTGEGRVVVLDFGIVHDLLTRTVSDDGPIGTAGYMAPEQAADEPLTTAADWYAVGTVLYEALTGALPFKGTVEDMLHQKLANVAPRASDRAAGVAPDLNDLCADLLRGTAQERPGGAEILARLGATAHEAPSGQHVVFVGRKAELGVLHAALERVVAGATVTVLVEGESGVGKSHLLRSFTEGLSSGHPTVLRFFGRCYERESVPYKAVDGVVDGIAKLLMEDSDGGASLWPAGMGLLAHAFPVLAPFVKRRASADLLEIPNPKERRQRVFQSLRELLTRMAAQAPLVLAVDDLQWGDADSLALLAEVLRPPNAPRVLLVAAARLGTDGLSSSAAAELPGVVTRIRLEKLPAEDTEELIARLLPATDTDSERRSRVRAIANESGGHPLFIDELVRQGPLSGPGGGSRVLRLDDALWTRALRVDTSARELLELTAVAGLPLPQRVLARAARIDPAELFRSTLILRAERFVRTSGVGMDDSIEPYHDRVRESVLAHLEAPARKERHRQLAASLEEEGARVDPEILTTHWSGAGDDLRAATYAVKAADRASSTTAFDHAARLYRLALELDPRTGKGREELERKLAEALTNAGRGAEAAEVRLALAERAETTEALDLRRRAAEQLMCSGHFDRGVEILSATLQAVGIAQPRSAIALLVSLLFFRLVLRLRGLRRRNRDPAAIDRWVLARIDTTRSAGSGLAMTDNVLGAYFQTRNLLLALPSGDPHRTTYALCMEVIFSSSGGFATRARTERLLASARATADQVGTGEAMGMAAAAAGYLHYFCGEWRRAYEWHSQAEQLFRDRCVGMAFEINSVRAFFLRALAYMGDVRALRERLPPVCREADERRDRYSATSLRAGILSLVRLADDTPDLVQAELDEVSAWLPERSFIIPTYWYVVARSQLALYRGDGGDAHDQLASSWRALERSLLLRATAVRVATVDLRGRSAVAAARTRPAHRDALSRVVEDCATRLGRESPSFLWPQACARMLLAALEQLRGGGSADVAASHAREAAQLFEQAGMALHAAAARARAGELVGGGDGADLVQSAHELMRSQGVVSPERFARLLVPDFATA
jgi:serine/threonine protein kinase